MLIFEDSARSAFDDVATQHGLVYQETSFPGVSVRYKSASVGLQINLELGGAGLYLFVFRLTNGAWWPGKDSHRSERETLLSIEELMAYYKYAYTGPSTEGLVPTKNYAPILAEYAAFLERYCSDVLDGDELTWSSILTSIAGGDAGGWPE